MTFETSDARVVFNAGEADERVVRLNAQDVSLIECDIVLGVGSHAQKLSAKILDRIGAWRDIDFGSTCKAYIQGTLVFSGTVTTPRYDTAGTAVYIELDAVGRSYLLYTKQIAADATYTSQTTGTIAKDIIDDHFSGTLTSTNMTTATGVTLTEFSVTVGENVGAALERLTKQDGYDFFVDVNDDVHYFEVSASSQLTISEEDLLGEPGERFVESGIAPPRNVVRIRGGAGYLSSTKQESQSAYYNLDSTTKYVAQRFQASTAQLSAIQPFLDYTYGANEPGTMTFEIREDSTASVAKASGSSSGTSHTLDASTKRFAVLTVTGDHVQPKYTTFTLSSVTQVGTPGAITLAIYTVDGSDKPLTLVESQTATYSSSTISATFTTTLSRATRYNVVIVPGAGTWDASNNYIINRANTSSDVLGGWESTDSGSTWSAPASAHYMWSDWTETHPAPSATIVPWSDDVSFAASDQPYPPTSGLGVASGWPPEKVWTTPKLALTASSYYWLVFKASSDASGTKYWRVGYYGTSDSSSSVWSMTSTDSGSTWSALNYDLTFRLFWSSDTVDYVHEEAGSIALYGEWYYEESLPDITTTAEATRIAELIASEDWYYHPTQRLTLPLKSVQPTLTPKQVVTVNRPLLDVALTPTIVEIRHEIRRDTARTTIITGALPYNAARALEHLRKVA